MKKRKILIWSIVIIATIIAIVAMCDIAVSRNAAGKTLDNVDGVPHHKVGLILGTSPVSTWNGKRNYFLATG